MPDQYNHQEKRQGDEVEGADRGLFDSMGKKKEEGNKCEGEVMAGKFEENVKVSEEEDTKKHETLGEKLQRSNSSTSSSDEEEIGEDGEKKKKKKGLKEKITDKHSGEKGEANVPIDKCDENPAQEAEEKKGFLDKIKEKMPGGKKAEEVASPPPTPATAATPGEDKEKKGFLDKIKDKIPG